MIEHFKHTKIESKYENKVSQQNLDENIVKMDKDELVFPHNTVVSNS